MTDNAAYEVPSAGGLFRDAQRYAQASSQASRQPTSIDAQPSRQPTSIDAQPSRQSLNIGAQNVRVTQFTAVGLTRARNDFLHTLLDSTFKAQTFQQVLHESREAAGKLQALGIAKQVNVALDKGPHDGVRVVFRCEDGSRYALKTGVNVGDDEGTANVTGRINNVWGGGEVLEASYSRGSKTQAAFQGSLSVPVNADPRRHIEVSASQTAADMRPYSTHDEVRRAVGVAYRAVGSVLTHDVRCSAMWRDICNLGSEASPTLRTEAGHTVKTSLAYTVSHDSRDSPTVPSRGSLVRATAEVAGLLGGLKFAKVHGEMQTNQRVGTDFVLATGVQGGVLVGPGRSPLSDRFFVGGQTSVRGFEFRGIGPRDHNDSIGGDVFYAAGVSLLTPLPYVQTPALRGHLWANAGQLALLDDRGLMRQTQRGVRDEVRRFFMCPSVAVGVGLVYHHSMVRVELSCGLPLVAALNDRPKPGLQFGMGVQFL